MAFENTDGSSSKMKFLVPLVVLLLCGVAMTGAAFAYNSTMDATVNADTNSYEITLGSDANVITANCTGNIKFDSVVGATTTYSVDTSANTATFTVYMKNNTNTSGFTLKASDITSVKVYSDAACTTEITSKISAAASVDSENSAESHVVTLTFSGSNLAKTDIPAKLYVQMTIKTAGTASA